ncbi:Nucleosomal histone H3-Lys79 methylase [Coemansia biformis]|uniref:Histone-lysine N-methyltransferase, H3 lysine-79 specific n=1 Tax=Coemansia biformis TaxID=1286918 RepID=A0A9W7YFE7_9FUNG|nr:Nucleosomal histone H3-Lys79 methylase [Coemansia biformis]
MSPRDSVIVNANRERVGSLPPSPRPRAAAKRAPRGSLSVRAEGQLAVVAGAEPEIGRCFSVPAHMGSRPEEPLSAAGSPAAARDLGSSGGPAAIVSSADAVRQSEAPYDEHFTWEDGGDCPVAIELHLPAAAASETFSLLASRSHEREADPHGEYSPISDLMATVRAIAEHLTDSPSFRFAVCGDRENGVMRRLERARNRRNGGDFVQAVREFNRLLDRERDAGHIGPSFGRRGAPPELAIHIIEQIYNRIVAPTVGMLRQYKAFSNNVYGEVLPTLISEFIERTGIARESMFIDLGCGIGNVVLQVAAQTGCHACGIEIMEVPARLAGRQAREFESRMQLYGLGRTSVQMWHGDFCESADVQRHLPRADVVLVNNYAFDSKLNQNLLQLFLDLKEGTRIISLKPFVTPDHKISARNIYSPESILTVRRYQYWSQSVSWTDSGGEYYVQTVDRSRMKEFLAKRGMT